MPTIIHPLASISPTALLGVDVQVGPFCVVEDDAVIGDRCILESRAAVKSGTTLGADNHVFEGAVLGGFPQHVRMPAHPGHVVIGSGNTIRENVTVHRALQTDRQTTIGDGCLLMVNVHIAHDCIVGNQVIMANNTMLAGHVSVADRAYLSGGVAVHQFCRIGCLAMVGGQAHIVKDIPPFMTVDGATSRIVGLNSIGLRRAGFNSAQLAELKAAYYLLYRRAATWEEAVRALHREHSSGVAAPLCAFLAGGTRGFTCERHSSRVRLVRFPDQEPAAELHRRAS